MFIELSETITREARGYNMNSKKELNCVAETQKHINTVSKFINVFVSQLLKRANEHDESKLDTPEFEAFAEYTPKLSKLKYDSPEYKESLKGLDEALSHHYAKNRHHPEHYPNGVDGMTLVDLIEMIADWKSSTLRMHEGNLLKSIEINAQRFNMSPQLTEIFKNTVDLLEHTED